VFTSFIYAGYTQDNAIIKRFRTDNGAEYDNAAMLTLLDKQGIIHDLSCAYSHESNGVAERYNRTIITAAHSLWTGLPLALWAEAIATAVYLRNRLPNRSMGKSTPDESLYHKKPSIYHLRPYGTKCFVHLPEEKRQPGTKLMPRAIEGYLIGYTSSPTPSSRRFLTSWCLAWGSSGDNHVWILEASSLIPTLMVLL